MERQLRMGIIGIGNMGSAHAQNILAGKCPRLTLAAVADIDPARLDWAQTALPGVARFADADDMLASGLLDAVLVSVPHYDHPRYAMAAMAQGLHVMVEKPAGVYTLAVREMNAAADRSGRVFGMMFKQRTNCLYRKMHEMVHCGQLCELKRVNWIITDWYRTQI